MGMSIYTRADGLPGRVSAPSVGGCGFKLQTWSYQRLLSLRSDSDAPCLALSMELKPQNIIERPGVLTQTCSLYCMSSIQEIEEVFIQQPSNLDNLSFSTIPYISIVLYAKRCHKY